MRVMLKVSIPVEAGNEAAKTGKLGSTIQSILEEQQPEATYFVADGGTRTVLVFLEMGSAADLPRIAEPWFVGLDAQIDVTPAFTPAEMPAAVADIERAVEKYG